MDIQTRDGILLRGIPNGTPEEEIKARLAAIRAERDGAPSPPSAPTDSAPSAPTTLPGDELAANAAVRFATGAAEPVLGGWQLVNRGLKAAGAPEWLRHPLGEAGERYQEMSERGRRAAAGGQDPGVDASRLLGNVLSPAGLIAGGAIKAAPTVTGRMAQGAGVGAGYGATALVENPDEDFAGKKAAQIGGGAVAGGAIPGIFGLLGTAVRGAYHIAEPYLPQGLERIKGRELNLAAGNLKNRLIPELENPREIIPGARPTGGEIAAQVGSAEFAGMQEAARRVNPTAFEQRRIAQDLAHSAAVRQVGRTPDELKHATDLRKLTADLQYEALRQRPIAADAIYERLLADPYVKRILPAVFRRNQADALAKPQLGDQWRMPSGDEIAQGGAWIGGGAMQNLRAELANLLKQEAAKAAPNPNTQRQIGTVLKTLDEWMERNISGTAAARQTYENLSRPINRMETGQALERTITPPETAFGQFPQIHGKQYTEQLSNVKPGIFTPGQQSSLEDVAASLARRDRYQDLSRMGAGENLEGMAYRQFQRETGGQPRLGILDRTAMITNAILARLEGRASSKLKAGMAQDFLDPKELARLMKLADTPSKRQALLNAIAQSQAGRFVGAPRLPLQVGLPASALSQELNQ